MQPEGFKTMHSFKAELKIIGINPFVFVPEKILLRIFRQAKKDRGHIPVRGTVNHQPYQQTLVKYSGEWRLYINTTMLKNSPKRIGESVNIAIEFDNADRSIRPHPKLIKALNEHPEAKEVFDKLTLSKQKEIIKYISFLKTEESIDKNVLRAIQFLVGSARFLGREQP